MATTISTEKEIPKAVLVGIQLPQMNSQDLESSLAELSRLVETLGYRVIGQVSQRRSSEKSAGLLGDGKLLELASWTGGRGKVAPMVEKKKHKAALRKEKEEKAAREHEGEQEDDTPSSFPEREEKAGFVIVDCELSPSQIRNLESATGAQVLDRTGVIIEIFSRHARSRAARLQVEIAKLSYMAPRLREAAGPSERIGNRSSGETAIELDKRKVRDRIKELKREIAAIGNEHDVRRARRERELTVALVGYTNAGKSSLMRALTGSEVLVADKLFATLDTTIRPLYPDAKPRILVSDTVGFIKKLPHDLVASFKSTLDEALNASLLLFVVDAADPAFRSQIEVTRAVLDEVGASDIPSLLILNKIDRVPTQDRQALQKEFPQAVMMSALNPSDVGALREKIIANFEKDMTDADLFVPFSAQGAIGEIRERLRVLSEAYDEKGVRLRVRSNSDVLAQLKKKLHL